MSLKSQFALLLTGTALLASSAHATPLLSHKASARHAPIPPSGLITLYDQTRNDTGVGIVSQNFESSFDAYDCEAADDFIVPEGAKWKIKEVDILGTTFDGSGQARSENVLFYKDRHGVPGKPKGRFLEVVGRQHFGDIAVHLVPGVLLKPGHYWLEFQVNEDFIGNGEWGWETSTVQVSSPAVWRNQGGGFGIGCTDWTTETECIEQGGDHLFALKGHAFELSATASR